MLPLVLEVMLVVFEHFLYRSPAFSADVLSALYALGPAGVLSAGRGYSGH